MSTTNITLSMTPTMEIALLGWMHCYPVKFCYSFQLFIQSVYYWQTDLKHDNSSGLVIYQHASAAVPFHPLVPFHTHTLTMVTLHTTGKCFRKHTFNTETNSHTESNGIIILSCTFWRSVLFSSCKEQRQAFQLSSQILNHPHAFAYTCKWQNHTSQLPHSCREW